MASMPCPTCLKLVFQVLECTVGRACLKGLDFLHLGASYAHSFLDCMTSRDICRLSNKTLEVNAQQRSGFHGFTSVQCEQETHFQWMLGFTEISIHAITLLLMSLAVSEFCRAVSSWGSPLSRSVHNAESSRHPCLQIVQLADRHGNEHQIRQWTLAHDQEAFA